METYAQVQKKAVGGTKNTYIFSKSLFFVFVFIKKRDPENPLSHVANTSENTHYVVLL